MRKAIGVILTIILIMCNCVGAWASQTTTTYDGTTYGGEGESKDVKGSYSVEGIKDVNGDGVPDTDTKNEQDGTSVPDGIPDTVPDIDKDGDGVADTGTDPNSPDIDSGNAISPNGAIYSVTITWGNMLYDYKITDSEWDPGAHTYTGGAKVWVPRNEEDTVNNILASNQIKVTNNSNVDVRVRYKFYRDAKFPALLGAFTPNMMKLENAVGKPVGTADSKSTSLVLTGDPGTEELDDATLGTVTVKIDYTIM